MKQTIKSIAADLNHARLHALQVAAGEHGDHELGQTCQRAIDGSQRAKTTVAKLIRDGKVTVK